MSELTRHKFAALYEMASGISSKPEQAGHGAPFLSFSTVFNNYFLPSTLTDRMDTSELEQKKYSINEGDIFLTRTSEVIDELGMSSVALKSHPRATYSGFLKRLRPLKERVTYPKFMAFYLRSPLFRKTMTNNAVLTLRASLNEEIFSYLDLLLPDYDEQVKAGDLLFLLSQKIDCNKRINTELEAMAKTLYDYWFVQFDFPDANGKPYKSSGGKMVYNATLKREIPAGWEAKCFAELGSFKNGINYDPSVGGSSTARIVNVRNVSATSIFIKENDLDVLNLDQNDIDKYLVTSDSILIARSGIPGATRMMAHCPPNTIYCGFIISLKVANPDDKLFLFFRLKQIEQSLLSQSSGSILKNVSQDTLKEIRIAMPPDGVRSVIEAFNTALNPIFGKLNSNHQESQQLAQFRDWLLPLLMNGQVTIFR
jgi:type I restriction enzyme, S subunit